MSRQPNSANKAFKRRSAHEVASASVPKNMPKVAAQQKMRHSFNWRVQKQPVQKNIKKNKSSVKPHQQQKPDHNKTITPLLPVPKAILLTPNSSGNSLTASISSEGALTYTITPNTTSQQTIATLMPIMQDVVTFRSRKAISQMDFKEARRIMHEPQSPVKALMPASYQDSMATMMLNEPNSRKSLYNNDMSIYVGQPPDARTASLRIFNTIMLQAWRKRRNEVRQLTEELEDLKRGNIKNKNQLHVYNSLFRVEQRRNEQLNVQLRRAFKDMGEVNSKNNMLEENVEKVQLENDVLKEQLFEKNQEFEDLNSFLLSTKAELFQMMSKQRDLLTELSGCQRSLVEQSEQYAELRQELEQSNKSAIDRQVALEAALVEKQQQLEAANKQAVACELLNQQLESKQRSLAIAQANEQQLAAEVAELKTQLCTLQQCLAGTLANRLKKCWQYGVIYNRATFHMFHWIAFYMLPATPPPPRITSLPMGLAIRKFKAIFNASFRSA